MQQSAGRKPFTPEQSVSGAMNQEAIITRLIGKTFTNAVVEVVAVEAGQTGAVGFVDVISLVQQMTANNEGIPNQPLYRLPYFRMQGGENAVIIDPKVGDIGLAAFAMRDISKVKKTKEESAPPSRREYDQSDGLYIGGFLNGAPKQYIEFLESGVNIMSTGQITMDCTALQVNAPINATGTVTTDVDIVAMGNATVTGAVTSATVTASGAILGGTVADATGGLVDMRTIYNTHTHTDAEGRGTSTPSGTM